MTPSWFFILQLLVPRPTNKREGAPFRMSSTAYLVHVQLHSLPGRHLHRKPEDAPHCADMDVLITADGTLSLLLLLLLLLSLSSSSLLCRVFILIFLRQTMTLRNTVLQLFCCFYSWCLYR